MAEQRETGKTDRGHDEELGTLVQLPSGPRKRRSRAGRKPVSAAYQLPDAPPEPGDLRDIRRDTEEPTPPDDTWSFENLVESDSYSRQSFYTQSTVDDQASQVVSFSLSTTVLHQIQALVQQRRFAPIQTQQDMFRDAVHHRLHDYHLMMNLPSDDDRSRDMARTIALVSMASALADESRRYNEAKSMHDVVRSRIEELSEANDLRGLQRLIEKTMPHADFMEEPWGGRMRVMLIQEAGRIDMEIDD